MSISIGEVLYSRISLLSEACVGTEDGSMHAVSETFVGEVIIMSHVTIDNIYCIVTTIGKGAFYKCPGLTNIIIPSTISLLKQSCFWLLQLTKPLILPSSVKTVETYFINSWGPNVLIFCGTKDPKTVKTGNNAAWISPSFKGSVFVPNNYEESAFCLKKISKKELCVCHDRMCFSKRKKRTSSLLFMSVLIISLSR